MSDVTLYQLSISFAILTGGIAGLLAVLAWDVLRESPFATALKLLAIVLSIATVYHGGLLVFHAGSASMEFLRALGYLFVLVALFAAVSGLRDCFRFGDAFERWYIFGGTIIGLGLYAVGGPLSEFFFPSILHWIHGVAVLSAIGGLYGPVHDDINHTPWNELIFDDASIGRTQRDWVMPIDDGILETLYDSGLVLTPAVVAYNIEYSREEVNRRLRKLESEGFVERVERGKYRIADLGEQYIKGDDQW